MQEEFDALTRNHTWDLVPHQPNQNWVANGCSVSNLIPMAP